MTKEDVNIFQMKLSLIDTEIWRRFIVRSDTRLPEFHKIIQTLMGWTNSHLHHFKVNSLFYGPPEEDFNSSVNYEKVDLEMIVKKKGFCFYYEYDFGDGWEHEIVVEDILPFQKGHFYPECLEGQKACPPEDCGGAPGYCQILDALKDKGNPENEEILEWLGNFYNPDLFDVKGINRLLRDENYGCLELY